MSYGDYNPDEVSDKFQDGLNLEGQGQGGGYGGGDGGDYEGTAAIKCLTQSCMDIREGRVTFWALRG